MQVSKQQASLNEYFFGLDSSQENNKFLFLNKIIKT